MLASVDLLLERVYQNERKGLATDRQALNAAIDHLVPSPSEREQIIDAVVQAGSYLDQVDGTFSLSRPIRRHGAIRPLALVTLVIITQCFRKDRDWKGVAPRFVNMGWERVYKPFGEVNATDKQRSDAEAAEVLRAATAANVVVRNGGTFEPNRRHPLVADLGERVRSLVGAIEANGGEITETDLRAALGSWHPSTIEFWLSALAGQRHITWKHRQDKVQLRRDSGLIRWLTALGGA